MTILKYELIKIFRKKHLLVVIIIFSLVNIYKINYYFRTNGAVVNRYNSSEKFSRAYWKVHNKISGDITDENINFVISKYKNAKKIVDGGNFSSEPNQPNTYSGYIFGDMNIFKDLYNWLNYFYNYGTYLDDVIVKAKDNIEFYEKRNNHFQVKNNKKIINIYGERSLPSFYDTQAYEEFLKYDFSSLLIILLLILGLTSVFSGECEVGLDKLIDTSCLGKYKTVYFKLLASFIYIIIISAYFFILDIVCFKKIFNLIGSSVPIYGMPEFQFAPLNIKIWEFVICSELIKLLGFFIIGSIILSFSSLFSQSIFPFILSSGFITLLIISNDLLLAGSRNILSIINPISLLVNREIFKKYIVVNIFGQPFLSFIVNIAIMIIVFIVLIFFILLTNKNKTFRNKINVSSYIKKLRRVDR